MKYNEVYGWKSSKSNWNHQLHQLDGLISHDGGCKFKFMDQTQDIIPWQESGYSVYLHSFQLQLHRVWRDPTCFSFLLTRRSFLISLVLRPSWRSSWRTNPQLDGPKLSSLSFQLVVEVSVQPARRGLPMFDAQGILLLQIQNTHS